MELKTLCSPIKAADASSMQTKRNLQYSNQNKTARLGPATQQATWPIHSAQSHTLKGSTSMKYLPCEFWAIHTSLVAGILQDESSCKFLLK